MPINYPHPPEFLDAQDADDIKALADIKAVADIYIIRTAKTNLEFVQGFIRDNFHKLNGKAPEFSVMQMAQNIRLRRIAILLLWDRTPHEVIDSIKLPPRYKANVDKLLKAFTKEEFKRLLAIIEKEEKKDKDELARRVRSDKNTSNSTANLQDTDISNPPEQYKSFLIGAIKWMGKEACKPAKGGIVNSVMQSTYSGNPASRLSLPIEVAKSSARNIIFGSLPVNVAIINEALPADLSSAEAVYNYLDRQRADPKNQKLAAKIMGAHHEENSLDTTPKVLSTAKSVEKYLEGQVGVMTRIPLLEVFRNAIAMIVFQSGQSTHLGEKIAEGFVRIMEEAFDDADNAGDFDAYQDLLDAYVDFWLVLTKRPIPEDEEERRSQLPTQVAALEDLYHDLLDCMVFYNPEFTCNTDISAAEERLESLLYPILPLHCQNVENVKKIEIADSFIEAFLPFLGPNNAMYEPELKVLWDRFLYSCPIGTGGEVICQEEIFRGINRWLRVRPFSLVCANFFPEGYFGGRQEQKDEQAHTD